MNTVLNPRSRPLVLVVDDEATQRLMVSAALRAGGFDACVASDGAEGLTVFAERTPDAVLLDVQMPGLDGFETCERLRALPGGAHAPVLMLTGSDDTEAIRRAFEVGATDFMPKPVNFTMLCHRVRYTLRASAAFMELHRSEARLARSQEMAKLGHWEMDLASGRFACSPAAHRVLGTKEEGEGPEVLFHDVHPADEGGARDALAQAIAERGKFRQTYRRCLTGGAVRHLLNQAEVVVDESGRSLMLGTVQDVTELRRAEEQIRSLAFFDGLTGLANRHLFRQRLEAALKRARRSKQVVGVLYMDLDRFKRINDTLGHHMGDELLKEVARRIEGSLRNSDGISRPGTEGFEGMVSRLGGDEFTVVLELTKAHDAAKVARRLNEAIARPITLEGREVCVGVSVGIAICPADGDDPDTLLKNADVAMYAAKAAGRNDFRFYDASLNAGAEKRLRLEAELRAAGQNGELLLYYQPKVDVRNGNIVGAEALIRWQHPVRGFISPAEFIPLAEESNLIVPINRWVLRRACAQVVEFQKAGLTVPRISVNISGRQFAVRDAVSMFHEVLEETGCDPRFIEIEITESVIMGRDKVTIAALTQLKQMGLRIAVDDFGTGYSSLAYLRDFPVDVLKIDRCFIKDLETDERSMAITRAIVAMAKSLNLDIVAEGVETQGQARILREMGCTEVQGYLYARPLPVAEMRARLVTGSIDLAA